MTSVSERRLRILLTTPRSAPARGGIESFLQHVSRGLARDHDVTLLTQRIDEGETTRLTDSLRPPPVFAPFDDHGVSVTQLRFTRAQRARMLPAGAQVVPGLRRYAYGRARIPLAAAHSRVAAPMIAREASEADLIHVWGGGLLASAGVSAGERLGIPVLITPFVHRGQWGDDAASKIAYRRADRVIGLLDYDCAVLRELGVAPDRVAECPVCSPGVPRGHGEAWRREHDVTGPLVAFLGVRRPYKGFDVLRAALPDLGRTLPSVTVAFAGPGEPILGEDAVRVIDRGPVSEQERGALLEAADVLCLPSAGEIFPVTILEAWSAETAVLTSDIPPLAELVRRSGGGIAVPRIPAAIAAGIAKIIGDGPDTFAARGHHFWRANATVDAVVSRHLELYRGVLPPERRVDQRRTASS
jgi:glycosyltransferase involved in cell wall biosynthesis